MLNRLEDVTIISSRDWLYSAGRGTEDGTVVEGVRCYLIAETPDGFRFQHNYNFCTGRVEQSDPDGFDFWCHENRVEDEAKMEAMIAKVQAHVDAGGKLDPDCWFEIQGCYGSAGWDEQAECELEAREREEEGWR